MARLKQRIERTLKTTSIRFLRANLRFKRRFSRRANCIFITALPKSGSTLLTVMAAQASGYLPFFLGDDHLNEQDLYPPKLIDSWSMNVVCHQHTRASRVNLERMRDFAIRPVILTRNVHDAVVSLADHLGRESLDTPTFSVPPEFLEMPREAQLDAIVDLALPWHLQFVAAWQRAEIDKLWLTYEELVADPGDTLHRVLAFYGLERDDAAIERAVAQAFSGAKTRFNKGVAGRGSAELSAAQKDRIAALARHFRDVDFTCIGMSSP